MKPTFAVEEVKAAFQLRYIWTGRLRISLLEGELIEAIESVKPLLEDDGLRILRLGFTNEEFNLLISTGPEVTPVFLAQRVQGRFTYYFRSVGYSGRILGGGFSVRSVGGTAMERLRSYVRNQAQKSSTLEPSEREFLTRLGVETSIQVEEGTPSKRGIYWYDLHLVYRFRRPLTKRRALSLVQRSLIRIAEHKGFGLIELGLVLDHVHLLMRGRISESPEEISLSIMNNLSHLSRNPGLLRNSYFVGTAGKFSTNWVKYGAGDLGRTESSQAERECVAATLRGPQALNPRLFESPEP